MNEEQKQPECCACCTAPAPRVKLVPIQVSQNPDDAPEFICELCDGTMAKELLTVPHSVLGPSHVLVRDLCFIANAIIHEVRCAADKR